MESNKPTEQSPRPRAGRNPADNLTQEDRVRGGLRSAGSQLRGPKGQFAGSVRRLGSDARPAAPESAAEPQPQPS